VLVSIIFLFILSLSEVYSQEQSSANFVLPEELIYKINLDEYKNKNVLDFYRKHTDLFHQINSQLAHWDELDRMTQVWGLSDYSPFTEQARLEKQAIIENEVLRYFRKQTKQPMKDQLKAWQRGLERNFEIDEQLELNGEQEVFVYDAFSFDAMTNRNEENGIEKEKKLNSTYKYKVRVRPLKGIATFRIYGPLFSLNSTVGLNNRFDLNMTKFFKILKIRANFNFQLAQQLMTVSFDKDLSENLRLRVSGQRDGINNIDFDQRALVSLNFFKHF
jgi:hypothetical protein